MKILSLLFKLIHQQLYSIGFLHIFLA